MLIFKTLPYAVNNAHSLIIRFAIECIETLGKKMNVTNVIKSFHSSKYLPIAFQQGLLPWEKIFLESHIPTLLSSGI